MIRINLNTIIDESELSFTASRSGGPGGQHVNKVSTRVTLSFDVPRSPSLTDEQKKLILQRLSGRMTKDGVLQISAQDSRSQFTNKTETINRFIEIMGGALYVRKKRRRTRAPLGANLKRLDNKRRRSDIKAKRGRIRL